MAKKESTTTSNQEAKTQKLTSLSNKECYNRYCTLQEELYRKGIAWLSQFVNKKDGIHPKDFAKTIGTRADRMNNILNGTYGVTQEMYRRIAIGIALYWSEIVKLRLARFEDYKPGTTERDKQEIKEKRIQDLKEELFSYFGIDARTVLEMLNQKEELVGIIKYYKEKYLHRFDKKAKD